MPTNRALAWFVDSSVVLRALLGDSPAAKAWFESVKVRQERVVGSRLLELEVIRTTRRLGKSVADAESYLNDFYLFSINDDLLADAAKLTDKLSGADSIHVATAMKFGPTVLKFVTHDREMAEAAENLGFVVIDPVTDDPNGTVAKLSDAPL